MLSFGYALFDKQLLDAEEDSNQNCPPEALQNKVPNYAQNFETNILKDNNNNQICDQVHKVG